MSYLCTILNYCYSCRIEYIITKNRLQLYVCLIVMEVEVENSLNDALAVMILR